MEEPGSGKHVIDTGDDGDDDCMVCEICLYDTKSAEDFESHLDGGECATVDVKVITLKEIPDDVAQLLRAGGDQGIDPHVLDQYINHEDYAFYAPFRSEKTWILIHFQAVVEAMWKIPPDAQLFWYKRMSSQAVCRPLSAFEKENFWKLSKVYNKVYKKKLELLLENTEVIVYQPPPQPLT